MSTSDRQPRHGDTPRSRRPIDSMRTQRFPASVDALWEALHRVDHYPTWWPWLVSLDAPGLEAGQTWRIVLRTPLAYRLRFHIALTEVVELRTVSASVTGDIVGCATIETKPDDADQGTELTLRSTLAPASPLVRALTWCAPAVSSVCHDLTVDRAMRQFAARGLEADVNAR